MPHDLDQRRRTYATVSNAFAQLDDAQLTSMLVASDQTQGWGGTHTVKIGATKVFVKKIPLTSIELDRPFNTANHYKIPTYYNYGVGSAGFGAYRELVGHIKSTNWVLSGACVNFPLMYHYRVVPFIGEHHPMDEERRKGYVDYWGGDAGIDRYMVERGRASHQIVLCLEHFPHVAHEWLLTHQSRWESFIRELTDTALFMRREGMIHFDIHMANVVLDGVHPYVADFGLVNARGFHLTNEEREFIDINIDYDPAYVASAAGTFVYNYYRNASDPVRAQLEQKYGISSEDWRGTTQTLIENIERVFVDDLPSLDKYYVTYVARHRNLIVTMHDFLCNLRANPRKDTPFPGNRIDLFMRGG